MAAEKLELISLNEAVEILGFHRQTVVRLLQNGELPGMKVGRQWRISLTELRRYFEPSSVKKTKGKEKSWQPREAVANQ